MNRTKEKEQLKPGSLKDAAVAALFASGDPEKRYVDLKEIGHGSFGAVFFVRSHRTFKLIYRPTTKTTRSVWRLRR